MLRESEPPYKSKTTVVFREFPGMDIDSVWHKLEIKSLEKWGRDLKGFDCVMVSKRSGEYKAFLAAEEYRRAKKPFKTNSVQERGSGHTHPFAQEEKRRNRH